MGLSTRPALQRFFRVAGRFLLVDASDEWSAQAFSRFFDGWYFVASEDVRAYHPDATIRIERRLPQPQVPSGWLGFELPGGGWCHSDGTAFYIEFGTALVTLGRDCSAEVRVSFGEQPEADANTLASVVMFAVSAALRRCGVFELHSAGVSEPSGGKSALLIGASGSGKSTLTLQLAARGWGYLSDDVLLLCEGGEGVEARGLRRDFAVTEEALAASGMGWLETRAGAQTAFDLEKRRLAPSVLFPSGFVASCLPTALFFPVITGEAESRVEELSQAEAMARLIRMCPWASYDKCTAAGHLRVLARLARQSAAFAIRAGRDLLSDPELAAKIISRRM